MIEDFGNVALDFKEECSDLLEAMEESLIELQDNGFDNEKINNVFRAAHTIKGNAGMFEIEHLVKFTHTTENLLDKIRNKEIDLTDEKIDILLQAKDHIEALVDFVVANNHDNFSEDLLETSKTLMEQLKKFMDPNFVSEEELNQKTDDVVEVNNIIDTTESKEEIIEDIADIKNKDDIKYNNKYQINLVFLASSIQKGIEPIEYLDRLRESGNLVVTRTELGNNFENDFLNTDVNFDVLYETNLKEDDIINIFNDIKDDVKINILNSNKEKEKTNIDEKVLANVEKKQPLVLDKSNDKNTQKVESKKNTDNKVKKQAVSSTLRVDAYKVDLLINQIGEMVIANASLLQKIYQRQDKELIETSSNVTSMLDELRELSMKIRMVSIGETFSRFKRIVRDLSKEIGKKIEFQTSGEDTEVDKGVAEKIVDPLIHLVRNSIDHGIEKPEVRKQKGKPEKGLLKLSAYHDSGSIVISIIDDGAGIDPDKIFNKAVEKGLISPDMQLSKEEIYNLIFLPGFSTAEKITNLSGRGVGMDVVKRNIEELRGSITINSELDKGTTISIKLPLTLAIIDGFQFAMGDTHYIIPLDMISECITYDETLAEELAKDNYINLRGEILPVLDLIDYFNINDNAQRLNILVVKSGVDKMGFIVGESYGKFQTVIKPIGEIFVNIEEISGATILGNGEVALIINVPYIIQNINIGQK